MVYESQISFTMDVICPWTYLAKKRLDQALEKFRSSSPASNHVKFSIKYFPYQLYPESSKDGQDKYEWYLNSKYDNSSERMQSYIDIMSIYGKEVGIDFNFQGTIANTLEAHRLIQHAQEEHGPDTAGKIVDALYESYHTLSLHPSEPSTLQRAADAASLDPITPFLEDPNIFLPETKALLREQVSNGVDTVPLVVFEGRRRDFTLKGAKEVGEYLVVMEKLVKETT